MCRKIQYLHGGSGHNICSRMEYCSYATTPVPSAYMYDTKPQALACHQVTTATSYYKDSQCPSCIRQKLERRWNEAGQQTR
jgi:hypothetical protein